MPTFKNEIGGHNKKLLYNTPTKRTNMSNFLKMKNCVIREDILHNITKSDTKCSNECWKIVNSSLTRAFRRA